VALDPGSADVYFRRGQMYYSRAASDVEDGVDAKLWFRLAAVDFQKAAEKDSRNYMAWDMLGMVHRQSGEMDRAIFDYTEEIALNPLGPVEARRCPLRTRVHELPRAAV
jgi:TPR repeat protein